MRIFKRLLFFSIFIVFVASCSHKQPNSMINPSHLSHLYQEYKWPADSSSIGTVWIYCDAPKYNLLADPVEGFTCVDDVARALVFWVRYYNINPNSDDLNKIKMLVNMVLKMQDTTGYFYNFLYPDVTIHKEHKNSISKPNFWSWRALWALTEANILLNKTNNNKLAIECAKAIDKLTYNMKNDIVIADSTYNYAGINVTYIINRFGADQVGLMMVGLTNYSKINNDPEIDQLILKLGKAILKVQKGDENTHPFGAFLSWQNIWHAWGNIQSYALLLAGDYLGEQQFIDAALFEINHFYPYLLKENWISGFSLNEVEGTIEVINQKQYPQIAYGVRPIVFACLQAYEITKIDKYAIQAGEMGSWFLGNNPANEVIYNAKTGICFDGINTVSDINYNSGAESTIEALLTIQAIEKNPIAFKAMIKYFKTQKTTN